MRNGGEKKERGGGGEEKEEQRRQVLRDGRHRRFVIGSDRDHVTLVNGRAAAHSGPSLFPERPPPFFPPYISKVKHKKKLVLILFFISA